MGHKKRTKDQDKSNFKRYFEYKNDAPNPVAPPSKRPSKRPSKSHKKRNDKLPLNEKFAAQYEETERRKLLQNAPSALLHNDDNNAENDDGSQSDSTSEDEDDLGELLTKRIDRRVRETLNAIRAKDPRIYDSKTRFFDDNDDNNEHDSDGTNSDAEKDDSAVKNVDVSSDDEPVAGWDAIAKSALSSAQKLTIKDYVRESLLNHGTLSDGEGEEEENGREEQPDYDHERDEVAQAAKASSSMYNSANKENDSEGGDGEGPNSEASHDEENNSDEEFFTKREKTAEEIAEEEKDFERFLSKTAKKRSEKAGQDMLLHSYLENETPDEKERFLRDFVLNNGWLNRNAGDAPASQTRVVELDLPVDAENGEESDDENDDDKFEDKADAFEASYNFRFEDPDSAKIATHSREVTGSLRRPDERRKKARKARLQRKLLEKAAKAEELKQIKNAKKREIEARLLAIQEAAGDDSIDLKGIDLEGDYDPEKFDKQMQERFGDEYYSREDDAMVDIEAGEGATATEVEVARKGKGRSKEVKDAKQNEKEDVDHLMDEYYKLDYEDIIGGTPVRFKYKDVEAESFNLSPEEILAMDDKELNQMVSIKLLAPYRSRRDVQKQAWKVRDMKRNRVKKVEDVLEDDSRSKRKRKRKDKLEDVLDGEDRSNGGPTNSTHEDNQAGHEKNASAVDGDNRHKRKRRKKKDASAGQEQAEAV